MTMRPTRSRDSELSVGCAPTQLGIQPNSAQRSQTKRNQTKLNAAKQNGTKPSEVTVAGLWMLRQREQPLGRELVA
jgi:hypothetical protein